jgi:hypothetical protein
VTTTGPDIMGMVSYTNTRARGYIDWNPTQETLRTLATIQQVLAEYADYLPMTARQIFYRLVGRNAVPKTEQAYARLLSILTKARRGRLIEFSAIRDDGTVADRYSGWRDPQHWLDGVRSSAQWFERDLRQGQTDEVEVWVEAAGMVPQVASMAAEFGVSVFSSGGFDSLTVKFDAASRIAHNTRKTHVLHVGDLDPSGVALFNAVREDVDMFLLQSRGVDATPVWERVAINLDQIGEYQLETAPPKQRKDAQTLPGGWEDDWPTVQAEAFAPDVLIGLIRDRITSIVDTDLVDAVRQQSAGEARGLVAALEGVEL